jgi:hypothetical protein
LIENERTGNSQQNRRQRRGYLSLRMDYVSRF